jgi:hypothetical protein
LTALQLIREISFGNAKISLKLKKMIVLKIRLFLKIKELLSAITPLKIWLILALPKLISLMSCKAVKEI